MNWLWYICTIASITSSAYTLFAAWVVRQFALHALPRTHHQPSVTILKPLYGEEPRLYDNLKSFCTQIYGGPVQVVFGVQRHDDPAIEIVRRLIAALPHLDLSLVIDEQSHGANRKVSNLINMEKSARHEVIVLADSDMAVAPDYLDWVVSALEAPGVGAVTCLYRGEAVAGFWSKLAVQAIDYHFLPNVTVGMATGLAKPCFGSTIALRHETLHLIGGFECVVDHLADDYALGEAVRALGLRIAIPPIAIAHCCSDSSLADLLRHELRWARTIALVDPAGFAGSVITHAFPIAIISLFFSDFTLLPASVVILALASRLILHINIARSFALPNSSYWLGPARDMLSFGVFVTCFFARAVDWRGQKYVVNADGTMKQSRKTGS